jgi:hypothetical protein
MRGARPVPVPRQRVPDVGYAWAVPGPGRRFSGSYRNGQGLMAAVALAALMAAPRLGELEAVAENS